VDTPPLYLLFHFDSCQFFPFFSESSKLAAIIPHAGYHFFNFRLPPNYWCLSPLPPEGFGFSPFFWSCAMSCGLSYSGPFFFLFRFDTSYSSFLAFLIAHDPRLSVVIPPRTLAHAAVTVLLAIPSVSLFLSLFPLPHLVTVFLYSTRTFVPYHHISCRPVSLAAGPPCWAISLVMAFCLCHLSPYLFFALCQPTSPTRSGDLLLNWLCRSFSPPIGCLRNLPTRRSGISGCNPSSSFFPPFDLH